jgi:hypothetical protein
MVSASKQGVCEANCVWLDWSDAFLRLFFFFYFAFVNEMKYTNLLKGSWSRHPLDVILMAMNNLQHRGVVMTCGIIFSSDYASQKRLIHGNDHHTLVLTLLTYGAEPFLRSCQLCSHSEKFPAILRNPKVHHGVRKSPPLVPILSQFNPVPTIPSYLSKIHFNIVHPHTVLGIIIAIPLGASLCAHLGRARI